MNGPCVGNIPPLSANTTTALNISYFTGICLQDAPLGVRYADFVTAFPAGITAAMTWSRSLLRQRGYAIGKEFKGKGAHVGLGPMANMGRLAEGGRNWEGFGADPWLSGEAAYETVLGMQQAGVQATAKQSVPFCHMLMYMKLSILDVATSTTSKNTPGHGPRPPSTTGRSTSCIRIRSYGWSWPVLQV
jgi:hypothetical protein